MLWTVDIFPNCNIVLAFINVSVTGKLGDSNLSHLTTIQKVESSNATVINASLY